ncbi:phosphatase PAP2 family protein [Plantactinospora sp. CA-290183]|uniref:phosphatase PAP2 family protein n=1 Tax=Plantactinospora sp. CA-290183 TaxID=3240006 RepID=UPI003D9368DC
MTLIEPYPAAGRHPATGPSRPLPPRTRRQTPRGLLGAALGFLIALALTCRVFVSTPGGQRLDGWLLPRAERGGGYEQRSRFLEPAKSVLTGFGDWKVLATLLVLVFLVALLTRRPWAGVAGVALFLCSGAGAAVLKLMVVRPDLGVEGSTTHNSFPSGHVAAATSLLLAFLLVLPGSARWWLAVPGGVGVSVVAAATMIAGWHRFSDVLGGVLLSAALCCLAAAASTYRRPRSARAGGGAGGSTPAGGGAGGSTPAGVRLGGFWAAAVLAVLAAEVSVMLVGPMAVFAAAGSAGAGLSVAVVASTAGTMVVVTLVSFLLRAVDDHHNPRELR